MAILDELKKYYKLLPAQVTIVNKKAAQIAYEIYQAAVENNTFADNEAFNAEYSNKLEKYIVYYDIGKYDMPCGELKIKHGALETEMAANRKTIMILEELFKDAKLSAEEAICKEILYYAIEKNEQFDGLGFPRCLKGDNISPIGRILNVADYIARLYTSCTNKDVLIKKMKLKIGKKFDGDVVTLAIGVVEQLYERERVAIELPSGEFRSIQVLHQPICECTNGIPKEYEGFICLNDEKLGVLMPAFYGPVAEKNGRMMDIAKYGLEFLFRDIANNKHAASDKPRTFSVHVSADCLCKSTFMTMLKKLIRDFSVNPQNLTFEVDALAVNMYDAKLIEGLKACKEMGIKLALDNYGVDNTSLQTLQDLDVDVIKIDRSFADKICDNRKTYEIVKNIIKMAADLDIGVVAKGVDTAQQKAIFLELKCLYMQGRMFGEPDYLSM